MNPKPTTAPPDLSVTLGPVRLANPVVTASGTSGYARELADFVDLSALGGFFTKSVTLEPRLGNPPQRTVETPSGLLNAIGLANVGLDVFCEEKIPILSRLGVPIFVNVAGKAIDEYVAVATKLSEFDAISGLELNISCPNVTQGGITFGTDPQSVTALVSAVRKSCPDTFLIVKLTPNVTDISVIARAAIEAGANALSMINTFVGMAIDIETQQPVLANRTGGVSGPAIKPMALYLVNKVYHEVARPGGVPIIGMGGIADGQDAVEFLLAGATAVAVGTAAVVNPRCLTGIIGQIRDYLVRHQMGSVGELVGKLK